MSDRPGGWTDDNRDDRYGQGSDSAQPEGARVMRHVQRHPAPPQQRPAPPRQYPAPPQQRRPEPPRYSDGYDDNAGYGNGYSDGQVYGGGNGGGRGYGGGDGGYVQGRPAPDWRRRIKIGALTLVVVVLAVSIGTYFWADSKLKREVDLSNVIERPGEGDGTNYLIVGSDSRAGMSAEDKKRLHTGSAEGKRTDSMMILHDGSNGPTLISLPRDSNVEIPSYKGSDSGKLYPGRGRFTKLNAAYAEDGPELLVRTVEFNTGLHIDHYVEIGFGGFAKIVDAIGGVELDIPKAFKDKNSGADFQAGKQTLNGEQSLAFVRTRYAFAGSDLDRTKNQQKFLAALASQTATPSTILNPFKLYPTMGAGLDTLIVDKDMSLWDLGNMFFAMKGVTGGDGKSMNMPISGSTGGNLVWDKAKVKQLVQQLNDDEKVTVSSN
ncbi:MULTISPECIES: LCP family protein [Streptomyces]|jgi:LCP family protein required for cell wall assembly|uniref:LCP family protein n=1 Tax=unclassified Streptomyces TaxID=2593676 RepID=UPI00088E4669|nr:MULTISPECIES: LCP family protein [unclassified Streptomyces]MDX2728563.1 LCP family protein [Streptomyces sp. PA03-2a]MDX3766159.1 LCP family protein [Streptomyces sp. AK08-01B]MDX3816585.1 LCP family protein [Streptomyces sp. AK08-01A]WSQ29217.1 LCP family protein [Streptomyces sp. NBC_01230]SCZ05166.1 cell envelope-related function transcriptional attenuator common domain-containing protein [Streptomyces sp. 136MFCol5.1]